MATHRLDFSCSSLSSTKSSASSRTSTYSNSTGSTRFLELSTPALDRAEDFWTKFERISTPPIKRKTVWQHLKKLVIVKSAKKSDVKITVMVEKTKSPVQEDAGTHPEGLYCVIDDFLETYSDGSEDLTPITVDEDYSEILDLYHTVEEDSVLEKVKTVDRREDREEGHGERGHDMVRKSNSDEYYSDLYSTLFKWKTSLK